MDSIDGSNDDDDLCQHPDGCLRSLFTYCPHCHLFLCMTHLNEHHSQMKNDVTQMLSDAQQQKRLLEEQIDRLSEQKLAVNELYDRELKNATDLHTFISHVCETKCNETNSYKLTSDYEKNLQQFNAIKQVQIPDIQSFIARVDQILQTPELTTNADSSKSSKRQDESSAGMTISLEMKEEMWNCSDALPIIDDQTTIELCSDTDSKLEESMGDTTKDDTSMDQQQPTDNSATLQSPLFLDSPNGECPLKHPNAFGLSSEHNVPGIPCDFMSKKMLIVTPNRCFYHLITYHHLRNNAARRIMEVLSSTENKDIDLTSIDLFSHLTSKEVLSTSVDLFVALCPLTHGSVYGLRSDLHYTSCNPRTPVHLCQHLRVVHHFKTACARRFIKAMLEKTPFTQELFAEHEHITAPPVRARPRSRK